MKTFDHNARYYYGLKKRWNAKDAAECRAAHKEKYEEIYVDEETKRRIGVGSLPNNREQIMEYLADGWGVRDISVWYGVTHSALRNMMRLHGIPYDGKETMLRTWNDQLNRFGPISDERMIDLINKGNKAHRKEESEKFIAETQAYHIDGIIDFYYEHRREPKLSEVKEMFGYESDVHVRLYWGWKRDGSGLTSAQAFREMYRAAGAVIKSRGSSRTSSRA